MISYRARGPQGRVQTDHHVQDVGSSASVYVHSRMARSGRVGETLRLDRRARGRPQREQVWNLLDGAPAPDAASASDPANGCFSTAEGESQIDPNKRCVFDWADFVAPFDFPEDFIFNSDFFPGGLQVVKSSSNSPVVTFSTQDLPGWCNGGSGLAGILRYNEGTSTKR